MTDRMDTKWAMSSERLVNCAFLAAVALIVSYLESLISAAVPFAFLPGMKLGLANAVITYAFFSRSKTDAFLISAVRITLSALLFGGLISLAYSAVGGILAFCGLFVSLPLGKRISYIGAGVICAFLHSLGQIAVAFLNFGAAALYYLPFLVLFSAVFGAITGAILNFITTKYERKLPK